MKATWFPRWLDRVVPRIHVEPEDLSELDEEAVGAGGRAGPRNHRVEILIAVDDLRDDSALVGTIWTHDRDYRRFTGIEVRDPFA